MLHHFIRNRLPIVAKKVSRATEIIKEKRPDLIVDGEIQADVALDEALQKREFPFCELKGAANILVFPNLESANIAHKLLDRLTDSKSLGPIVTGLNKPAYVLQMSSTADDVINMIYLAAHRARVIEA